MSELQPNKWCGANKRYVCFFEGSGFDTCPGPCVFDLSKGTLKSYDVSLSPLRMEEWDEPKPVLSFSPRHAAEIRLKREAYWCDDYLGSVWDAHVTETEAKLNQNWYFRLSKPRRFVETRAREIK